MKLHINTEINPTIYPLKDFLPYQNRHIPKKLHLNMRILSLFWRLPQKTYALSFLKMFVVYSTKRQFSFSQLIDAQILSHTGQQAASRGPVLRCFDGMAEGL